MKTFLLVLICSVQAAFAQKSDFSFKVNSAIDFYDSGKSEFSRRFLNETKSVKAFLTNDELKKIQEKFNVIQFKKFPAELKCGKFQNGMPIQSISITLIEKKLSKEVINKSCEKQDKKQEENYMKLWEMIFEVLKTKKEVKNLKPTDITYL